MDSAPVLLAFTLGLSLTGGCKKHEEKMAASRERLISEATSCPAPATCTGKIETPSREVSVCAPPLDPQAYAGGDIVILKELGIHTVAKVKKRSGKVYVVEFPDGFELERAGAAVVGRVCK